MSWPSWPSRPSLAKNVNFCFLPNLFCRHWNIASPHQGVVFILLSTAWNLTPNRLSWLLSCLVVLIIVMSLFLLGFKEIPTVWDFLHKDFAGPAADISYGRWIVLWRGQVQSIVRHIYGGHVTLHWPPEGKASLIPKHIPKEKSFPKPLFLTDSKSWQWARTEKKWVAKIINLLNWIHANYESAAARTSTYRNYCINFHHLLGVAERKLPEGLRLAFILFLLWGGEDRGDCCFWKEAEGPVFH